jgi:hypothetical protein
MKTVKIKQSVVDMLKALYGIDAIEEAKISYKNAINEFPEFNFEPTRYVIAKDNTDWTKEFERETGHKIVFDKQNKVWKIEK